MSATVVERLERRVMSVEEFHALPEGIRAEYVDGVALVTPPARMPHNEACLRLALVLRQALPELHVGFEMGLHLGAGRFRVPDLAAVDHIEDVHWTAQTPHLVVEVLSPSTRGEDTLRKSGEYAAAGIGQYWVLDPDHRTLTVLGNRDGVWDLVLELDAERPRGEATVGECGVVPVDLDQVLAH